MCGIEGILNVALNNKSFAGDIDALATAVAHRGPDDHEVALFGPGGAWAPASSEGKDGKWGGPLERPASVYHRPWLMEVSGVR